MFVQSCFRRSLHLHKDLPVPLKAQYSHGHETDGGHCSSIKGRWPICFSVSSISSKRIKLRCNWRSLSEISGLESEDAKSLKLTKIKPKVQPPHIIGRTPRVFSLPYIEPSTVGKRLKNEPQPIPFRTAKTANTPILEENGQITNALTAHSIRDTRKLLRGPRKESAV